MKITDFMKKNVTHLTVLLFMVMACIGKTTAQDCNPPRDVKSTLHAPEWYHVNLSWDIPIVETGKSRGTPANEFIYATDASPRAFYKSTLDNPATDNHLANITASNGVSAMEYINGQIYYIDRNTFFGTTSYRVGEMDPNTGTSKQIVSHNAKYTTFPYVSSIAWNPMSDKVYVSSWGGATSSEYGSLNITDGSYTKLGLLGGTFTMAIDNMGTCYAVAIGNPGQFGTIDLKTGIFTKIADISFSVTYLQDISVDRATNELYWIAREDGNTDNRPLYKIDKATGKLELKGTLPYNQISAFAILNELGDTNPFKFNVYRNSEKITKEPIVPARYTDFVPGGGSYKYEIEAVYGSCASTKAEHTVVMEQDECEISIPVNPYPLKEGFESGELPNKCWR